ncbi:hypothetical protein IV102_16030 [bacterium]|nr:hypothetical protein [bacterium]
MRTRFVGCWFVVLLIVGCKLTLAGPPIGLLLIFNSNQSQSLKMHRNLVELLKQKRSEGYYAGTGLGRHFFAYNVAEPAHAATLKSMGITHNDGPLITLTELDSRGAAPVKITWRCAYQSPQQALAVLDQQLGIATVVTTIPGGPLRPLGYGFSIEIPYPVTQTTPIGSSAMWQGHRQGEGLAYVSVGNVSYAPDDRQCALEAIMTSFLRDSNIQEVNRETFTQLGMTGLKVTGRLGTSLAQVRILCGDNRIYHLMFVSFRNDESVMQKFFESLATHVPSSLRE